MAISNDTILRLIAVGHIKVDVETGEVFSMKANNPNKPLGSKTSKGYLRTVMNVDGELQGVMIHRIVCLVAHGLPPSALHNVNHINTIKTDNRGINLEWSTNKENCAHAGAAGLMGTSKGEEHYRAKLTNGKVRDLRKLFSDHMEERRKQGRVRAERNFIKNLAKEHSISTRSMWLILIGKSYRDQT